MKRYFYSLFILVMSLPTFLFSQTISGKLVDQNGNGLSGLQLQLYISPQVYNTTSGTDGTFIFNNVTDVKEEQLPIGYAISNNYPNPFNPKTRIGITLPNSGNVRVDVYNLLGQSVRDEIEKYFNAGDSYIDLELNGLPNGFYLARITLDEKYVVTKKLMLLYGSQHLSSSSGGLFSRLNKTTMDGNSILDTKIDSLVVSGSSISKKVFTDLPSMIGNSLNLGNLIITLPVPDAPTLSSPLDGTTGVSLSPTLYWNVSSAATSYTLQVSISNTFSSYAYNESGLTNVSKTVTGLSNWTTYYWRVSATNSYGTSAFTSSWLFTTIGTPPDAPTLSLPTNNAVDISVSPTLTWNASSTATSYTLQVSVNSSFTSFVYNQSGLTSTSQTLSGLSNLTQYYWRVSATNSYGTSNNSSSWSFTTIGTPPSAPTLSTPTNNAVDISVSPTLSWNSNIRTISYTLQVSTNSTFSNFVYNQSGLSNTFQQISGLNNSTAYYWRVSATNSYGTSDYSSTWSFTTIGTPPSAPTLASPVNNAVDISLSPMFGWNASTTAISYTLQVSTNSTFTSFVYNQSGLTNTFQQISGLSNSTMYYWRVSATNISGSSNWSSTFSFRTVCISSVTYAGKTYNTVRIGTQCWLKENLDVGTMIQGIQNASNNSTIEKYCYDNNPNNCATYGGLYQWNEAMAYSTAPGTKGICPDGWHIPTSAEFQTLASTVNNDGNALKAVGQGTGSGVGTNSSGFSGLLAGNRHSSGFIGLMDYTYFWHSTEVNATTAYAQALGYGDGNFGLYSPSKDAGWSVRCIKD